MSAVQIEPLTTITEKQLRQFIKGYTSNEKYVISKEESERTIQFSLELVPLEMPYVKRWGRDIQLEDHYQAVLQQGLSIRAMQAGKMIGIAIAEERAWNHTLWVWEFHILDKHQGRGIGMQLMEALVQRAYTAGLRVIALETQNTNVPAIRFYRKVGFEIEGIDLSYYSNRDLETDGEVALFMKRKIADID